MTAPVSVDSNFVLNILDLQHKCKETFAVVSSFIVSVNKPSVRLIRVFPQMNKVDSIHIICRSLV